MKPFFQWRRFEPFDPIPVTGIVLAVASLYIWGLSAYGFLITAGLLILTLPVWMALRIGPDSIVLDRCWWFLPIKRRRFRSDASVCFYESLDADAPEALYIETLEIGGSSDAFAWPMGQSALARLLAECEAAVEALRQRRLATAPPDLVLLPEALRYLHDSLDLRTAERNQWTRLASVRTLAAVTLGGVAVPARSLLMFDADKYRDPETSDRLRFVDLAQPAMIPPIGRTTRDGARLSLAEDGALVVVLNGFEGTVDFGGWPLAGDKPIGLATDSRFNSGTLAATHPLGAWQIPVESRVSSPLMPAVWPVMFGRPKWSVVLGAAFALPEIELRPGDRAEFDASGVALSFSTVRPVIELHDGTVETGRLPIPLRSDGAIDREKCRRLKIWKG